jgi:hypothetical protein
VEVGKMEDFQIIGFLLWFVRRTFHPYPGPLPSRGVHFGLMPQVFRCDSKGTNLMEDFQYALRAVFSGFIHSIALTRRDILQ